MSKTILVVDDSATMRSLVVSYLMEQGDYKTIEAPNGFEALKLLPTENIDLILTDINMPDINGLEFINFVKNSPIYKQIPIIIITTEKSESDRKRGLSLGASEYIFKPFSPRELEIAVNSALAAGKK